MAFDRDKIEMIGRHAIQLSVERAIADSLAEITRLQATIDEKADLPHSCSDSCMRPACVLRRENREQAKEIERLKVEVLAWRRWKSEYHAAALQWTPEWLTEARRANDAALAAGAKP